MNIKQKNKKLMVGAIHFPPLMGYPDFPGIKVALKNALADLKAFERGGFDAVIIENNYDIPHQINVSPAVVSCLSCLGKELRVSTKLPMGISVLWNDYRTALATAKIIGLQFVRIPVFVDRVETDFGIIEPSATEVKKYQKLIGADNIKLFVDIHVKHAKLLSPHSLAESAKMAITHGADAVIVTGKWTGDAPDETAVVELKKNIRNFPIILGSGIRADNAKALLQKADGVIVSTSLKKGRTKKTERNVKAYSQRISFPLAKKLVTVVNSIPA